MIMRGRKVKPFLLAAAVLAFAGAARGDDVSLRAMLIYASNEPAPLDQRLEKVEYKLRRILQFETYRFLGDASAILQLPGEVTMDLGQGHRLQITADKGKKGVGATVEWWSGEERLLTTRVTIQSGSPAILGGPKHKEGNLIVVLERD